MNSFLEQLAKRLQVYDADILTADETKDWPDGKLNELIEAGILTEIEPAKGIVCDQCEENCDIEPEIKENPVTGKNIGVFVCNRGRIEVDLDRLRRWKINSEKLEALGYTKKKPKQRKRKVSSELTPKETDVFTLIHVHKKTQQQAAIEMGCTPQNVSKLKLSCLKKMKARNSRSINLSKAQKLPEDRRGQTNISNKDI